MGLDRLIDLILQFIGIFQFATVLAPYQQGVRVRLGKWVKVLGPGLHIYFPLWIDKVITENTVVETRGIKPQSLTTKDGKAVVLSGVVTFEISNVRTFLLEVEGRNAVVEDTTYGAVSNFIMKHTWPELMAMENIGNEVTKAVRAQTKKYGINIINVQLADFVLCRSLRLLQSQSYHG